MAVSTIPRLIAQPPSWRELVDLAEAQQITGLTAAQLRAALAKRDGYLADQLATTPGSPPQALRRHIPNPASRSPLQWRRGSLTLWTYSLGIAPKRVEGVDVIGYTGLSMMLDVEEQSVRAMASDLNENAPEPVFKIGRFVLFDKAQWRQWAIQSMCLAADGVTPTRRRPRRT